MAYKKSYRRRRTVFSNRQKDAIERIAKGVPETKVVHGFSTLAGYLGDTGGSSSIGSSGYAFQNNPISTIPLITNTSAGAAVGSVIGREFNMVGLRWEADFATWQGASAPNPGALYDYWFRFTVFEYAQYDAGNGPLFPVAAEDDLRIDPTAFKWNPDTVKIRMQKNFKLDCNGNLNAIRKVKFWCPIKRKIVIEDDPSGATNATVGRIQGMNIFWSLEIWSPGNEANIVLDVPGNIAYSVYFKDA